MPNLDLPIEGYQTEADPNGYALPVAQDFNPELKRVYISSPGVKDQEEIKGPTLKEVEHDPWETGKSAIEKLFGLNGQERYQTWPEKLLREGVTAAGDVMQQGTIAPGLRREDFTDIPAPNMPTNDSTWLGKAMGIAPVGASPADNLIEKAQAMSALAGSGGLAGAGEGTALGSGPMLRPALKYKDKIYKAPVGGQHLDALPPELYPEFQKMAMSGEDISHYNFGFMNHKGQFLDREKALDYAVKEGLVDPSAGQYGALTSTLLADSSKPGTAIESLAKAEPFYSALEHNVKQINQSKMNGEAWLGTLANKPGVKPEELQWTGLKEFLEENKGKPVTKAQIEEHLQNNKVELREVDKGEAQLNKSSPYYNKEIDRVLNSDSRGTFDDAHLSLSNDAKAYETLMKKHPELKNDEDWASTVLNSVLKEQGETKYHSYQLPGAENYREKLLTLPGEKDVGSLIAKRQANDDKIEALRESMRGTSGSNETRAAIRELQLKNDIITGNIKDAKSNLYRSSHWDEPNILAHVRMNDRVIDGKKSLHLEEIQSDWHQIGRDKGYHSDREAINKKGNETLNAYEAAKAERDRLSFEPTSTKEQLTEAVNKVNKLRDEVANLNSEYKAKEGAVPDAPFKKTWHELALKRMIREAAEKGYDRLSWTPGEAQAARYDLSKSVDTISAMGPDRNGKYLTYIEGKDKQPLYRNQNGFSDHGQKIMSGEELEATVGKDLAKKLMEGAAKNKNNERTNGFFDLKGDNLKIGGEGMKGFYDQIIPKSLEKISGQKVKTANLTDAPKYEIKNPILNKDGKEIYSVYKDGTFMADMEKSEAKHYIETKQKSDRPSTVHYIDIPPELKDRALGKGFPLFSKGFMLTPVDKNPFDSEQK